MKNFLKNNLKVIIAIVITAIISGGSVYAATQILASDVVYDNTNSGLSATNAQDALDELYTKANTWINPSYIDFTTLATNTKKTILSSKNGICIKRNNKVSCFKINNWAEEQNHIQQVFSDVSCSVYSDSVACNGSDFLCGVDSTGRVDGVDKSDGSYCTVSPGGSVGCT